MCQKLSQAVITYKGQTAIMLTGGQPERPNQDAVLDSLTSQPIPA